MAELIPVRSLCLLPFVKKLVKKHSNLYLGLVMPSSGWYSPIVRYVKSHGSVLANTAKIKENQP
jgi:hypothetical protein